jgi:anti-anti-sigma regulatory factor
MSHFSSQDLLQVETLRDGVFVHYCTEALDRANAGALAEDLSDLAKAGCGPYLYLDLAEVQSLSRYILLRLAVLDRRLQELGDRLIVFNPQPEVCATFLASGLTPLLEIRAGLPDSRGRPHHERE